jgi:hypothetical protein
VTVQLLIGPGNARSHGVTVPVSQVLPYEMER